MFRIVGLKMSNLALKPVSDEPVCPVLYEVQKKSSYYHAILISLGDYASTKGHQGAVKSVRIQSKTGPASIPNSTMATTVTTETHGAQAVETHAAAVCSKGAVASKEGLALSPEVVLIISEEFAKLRQAGHRKSG